MRFRLALAILLAASPALAQKQQNIALLPFTSMASCQARSHAECQKRGCSPEVLYWWHCTVLGNGSAVAVIEYDTKTDDSDLTPAERNALIGGRN